MSLPQAPSPATGVAVGGGLGSPCGITVAQLKVLPGGKKRKTHLAG